MSDIIEVTITLALKTTSFSGYLETMDGQKVGLHELSEKEAAKYAEHLKDEFMATWTKVVHEKDISNGR